MTCAESLRTQAYFDGEVDAITAAGIERHTEHCEDCTALLEDLRRTRNTLRNLPAGGASPELRARIRRAIDEEQQTEAPRSTAGFRRPRPFWMGALSGAAGSAAVAILAFFLFAPRTNNLLLDELAAAHVRSLMPSHLIDVLSTDQHTVKPWFAGHADVSPVVADFGPQGYRLIGGRADYFDHQRSAVVVYQHGAHVINVFSWAARRPYPAKDTTRNGYRMAFWQVGDLEYCAVSDTGWDELRGLTHLLQDTSARDEQHENVAH